MSAISPVVEARLLSALMKGPSAMDTAMSLGLRDEMFTSHIARTLFTAIKLSSSAGSLAVDDVFSRLPGSSRDAETIGSLVEIAGIEPTSLGLQSLVMEVAGTWRKAALRRAALAVAEQAAGSEKWEDVWPAASARFVALEDLALTVTTDTNESLAARAKASFMARKRGDEDYGLSFGISAVDRAMSKIKPGELVLLAARPSAGKSSFAGQLASNILKRNGRVAVFNLETRADQYYDRTVIQRLGMPDSDAWGTRARLFEDAYDAIGKHPGLFVFDSLHDIDAIEARIRALCAGKPLDLVVIDYIQQVRVHGLKKDTNKEREVSEVSRRLKLLTNVTKTPVVAIAQFNREAVKDGQIPKMHHLRDSGSLEQDADRIIILHQEPLDGGMPDDRTNVETAMIQEKAKDAPRGVVVRLMFNRPIYTFFHIDNNHTT